MRNNRKVLACLCVIGVITIGLATGKAYWQISRNDETNSLGFPVDVLSTENWDSLSTSVRTIRLFVPIEYYSRGNIDGLFRFYSKKYPHKNKEKIEVYIYTDKENFKRHKERPVDLYTIFPRSREQGPVLFDASFYRDPGNDYTGRVNEWYVYKPNLNNPNQTKTVVIKGRAPSIGIDIGETWETTNNAIKIRVTAYNQKGVEPQGTYYTFESVKKELVLDAREIMTFRHADQVLIPRAQVRFVNDQVAYVFMGWLYAVTTDSGYSWSVWDAERDLRNWQCCNYELINEIRIEADGVGTMRLNSSPQDVGRIQELHTTDYGRHWTTK
jgi:hypothetical protein